MTKDVHVMVDLETLSVKPDAAIISIGAVKFNSVIMSSFYSPIELQSVIDAGFSIDGSTLAWWMGQSDPARAVFSQPGRDSLPDGLAKFKDWIGKDDVYLWGDGATFDNVILRSAYRKCGMLEPWSWFNDRCYRTVKNMYPDIKLERQGVYHNAVDDALSQALHLMKMGVIK